jgi:TPP-dependent pyruvate/acetoin dehydrogenase alpha subunit
MKTVRIEDNDIFAVYNHTKAGIDAILSGKSGPLFMECFAYRWKEHVGPNEDFHLGYRTEDEYEKWRKDDQLVKLRKMLDDKTAQEIESEIDHRIDKAFDFAENSPFPQPQALYEDVYK